MLVCSKTAAKVVRIIHLYKKNHSKMHEKCKYIGAEMHEKCKYIGGEMHEKRTQRGYKPGSVRRQGLRACH